MSATFRADRPVQEPRRVDPQSVVPRQHLPSMAVTVQASAEPIDVESWVRQYVAHVLATQGYPAIPESPSLPHAS